MTRHSLPFIILSLAAAHLAAAQNQSGTTGSPADPYVWLEDQNGARALAWVNAENAKTIAVLERDPRFASLYRDALAVSQASDRIPVREFHRRRALQLLAGQRARAWNLAPHVARELSHGAPQWTTVLDLDSLARAEKANWVWQGADCSAPAERRCMISLSDGGEDAVTVREFDVGTRQFVPNGFVLPHGKQSFAWVGEDTLLVSREWNAGRAHALGVSVHSQAARAGPANGQRGRSLPGTRERRLGAVPVTFADGTGHRAVLIVRVISSFEARNTYCPTERPGEARDAGQVIPVGMMDGQIIVQLSEAWNEGSVHIRAGSLASFDVGQAVADPTHLAPVTVFEPGPRESVGGVAATRDRLVASIYQNVRGRVFVFSRSANGGWTAEAASVPGKRGDERRWREPSRRRGLRQRHGVPDADQRVARRRGDRRGGEREGAAAAVRRVARHGRAVRGDLEGRHEGAVLRRASEDA